MSSPVPKKDMSVCQQQIVNVTSDKSSLWQSKAAIQTCS
jgi:hypothetical protein